MHSIKFHSMNEQETISELTKNLSTLIPNMTLENVTLEVPIDKKSCVDIIIKVKTGRIKKCLFIDVKSSGEPRIVQSSIYQLKKLIGNDKGKYPVFASPYISKRSRDILASENIGYIDLIGDVYLKFDSVLIDRISNIERETERRLSRGIFASKATRIIRTLLNAPQTSWKITELANISKMSPSGVYFVINQLEDKGYVSRVDKFLVNSEIVSCSFIE